MPRNPGPVPEEPLALLVARARAGDALAEEALLVRCLPRVRQIVGLRLGVPAGRLPAEDPEVRVAILRVLRRVSYEPSPSSRDEVPTGPEILDQAAKSLAGDLPVRWVPGKGIAGLASCPGRPWESLAELASSPDEAPSASEPAGDLAERVEQLLLRTDPQRRELIVLRALCGFGFEEIARRLGIREPTVARSCYCRALRDLERGVRG